MAGVQFQEHFEAFVGQLEKPALAGVGTIDLRQGSIADQKQIRFITECDVLWVNNFAGVYSERSDDSAGAGSSG